MYFYLIKNAFFSVSKNILKLINLVLNKYKMQRQFFVQQNNINKEVMIMIIMNILNYFLKLMEALSQAGICSIGQ